VAGKNDQNDKNANFTIVMNDSSFNLFKTEDGTLTLYSSEYGQAMHSVSGAYNEALYKHVFPSKILENNSDELFVLDIGFGLGYNILALVAEFLNKKTNQKLHIFSLEKDSAFFSGINMISFNDERDILFDNIKKSFLGAEGNFSSYSIQLVFGDARKTICSFTNNYFDAVFHDPFSPSKNPELWSAEFFCELFRIMKTGAVLTTYSSAMQIRNAMLEAGFYIGKGPSVGKKKEGTLASKSDNIPSLSSEDILRLRSDVKSTPYRDPGSNKSREEILQQRLSSIREIRNINKIA
jgi:tRNA U34 5-methylaminomethyl-2-thiouridine-forming methyltransferase MnmC